jgi:hypothetical protein
VGAFRVTAPQRFPEAKRKEKAVSEEAPKAPTNDVGLAGVEPATSPLSGVRSNQLSYRPETYPEGP